MRKSNDTKQTTPVNEIFDFKMVYSVLSAMVKGYRISDPTDAENWCAVIYVYLLMKYIFNAVNLVCSYRRWQHSNQI
jgi:uncharacterized PurR-regulated membrane protein YhhQ (DUF165 family)